MEDSTPFAPLFRAPRVETCVFDPCADRAQSRNLCWGHYKQWVTDGVLRPKRGQRAKRMCKFEGCERKHSHHGWCATHALQASKGTPMSPVGARRTTFLVPASGGYVMVHAPAHPNARISGYVLQHILVISALLGRPLAAGENVHHKNGDRTDNRPENLELWSHSQPKGQRVEDKVAWAIDLLRTYQPDALAEGARNGR